MATEMDIDKGDSGITLTSEQISDEVSKQMSEIEEKIKESKKAKLRARPPSWDPKSSWKVVAFENWKDIHFEDVLDELEEAMDDDELPGDMKIHVIDPALLTRKQSPEEKRQNKKKYREQYIQRPEVKQKKAEKESNPKTKIKRQEYAKKPETVQQKQIRVQVRQGLAQGVKRKYPEIYKELEAELLPIAKEKIAKKAKETKFLGDDGREREIVAPPFKKQKTNLAKSQGK
jgi:hypothetical protein